MASAVVLTPNTQFGIKKGETALSYSPRSKDLGWGIMSSAHKDYLELVPSLDSKVYSCFFQPQLLKGNT